MSLERFTRRQVVTVAPDREVGDVARLMASAHVGTVLVVEDGRPIGIVTDRDLVTRFLAGHGKADCAIRALMSWDLAVVHVEDSIDMALSTMRQRRVRRLPIVGRDGELVGIVALDDLLVLLGGEAAALVETVVDNHGP